MAARVSAGILLYRRRADTLEVLLGHPGGPYFEGRDAGIWTIPKGLVEPGEDLENVAAREFAEETGSELVSVADDPGEPPLDLGTVTQASGKIVRAWAVAGDLDPATASANLVEVEWPRRSGRRVLIPELDRVAWFAKGEGRRRINPAQASFIDRLEASLPGPSLPGSPSGSEDDR